MISDELREWCDLSFSKDDFSRDDFDKLRELADRIDREMVELPKDANGEPIRIGDVLYSRGNECRVVSITVKADEACVGVHTDEGVFLPSVNPKYLSRKNPEPLEPKVLDVDGVPIEVGDTVYCDDSFEQFIVDSFDGAGCIFVTLAERPDGITYTIEPSRLSHEFHDNWERIADELEGAEKWCDQNGDYDTGIGGASVESVASIDKAIKWWNMRAIDKDELLRCKECKYGKAVKQIGCIRVIDRMTKQGPQDENGFCSLAERDGEK